MRLSLNVLDDHLISRIIDESISILAEIGMEIRSANLREQLLQRGLREDQSSKRLLFPLDVVEKALSRAPESFTLYKRNGQPHTVIGGDAVHFTPASSALKILDHRSGESRLATTADFVEYIRLVDGMEHIAYPSTAFSTNEDIDPQVSDAWRLYLCLIHSIKPVVSGAFTEHGVPRMGEMMALFCKDREELRARPMSIFTITATGNFRYSEDSCQNLLDCAEWGIPVEIVPVTLMGLIAPVTLVGAAVFHTVDVLAGVVMAQLIKPGTPVIFGGAPASFHMSEASAPMLGIEALHLDVIYAAIGKTLKLPTQAYMALSDAKFLDAQAGAETFGSGLLAGLAGVNSVSGPGMLDYVLTFSLPKLVFDNELCGQIHHLLREVAPIDDLPTVELVKAQLADEHMLTSAHTLTHWPQQLYLPGQVFDRKNEDSWAKAGSKDLMQRATEEVEERLANYTPIDTSPDVDAEMRRLIEKGITSGRALPPIPPLPEKSESRTPVRRERRQNRRKRVG
ncbi:MAG: trimethylamine methyltransferase family protein [Chloroflexota bacterium]